MKGGAKRIQNIYFCSECGNLYDITNTQSSSTEKSKQVQFICTTCGHTEIMKPNTLILSKKSKELAKLYVGNIMKPENVVHSATLPHTRDYICPNKECETHSHPELRDATMSRIGNSFKIQYICSSCLTSWS